jgi:hypothetical protein
MPATSVPNRSGLPTPSHPAQSRVFVAADRKSGTIILLCPTKTFGAMAITSFRPRIHPDVAHSSPEIRQQRKNELEKLLMTFSPDKCIGYIYENIHKANDIVENKFVLIKTPYESKWLNYLLDVIIQDIDKGIRFQRLGSLKVIKSILKNKMDIYKLNEPLPIAKETTNRFFYIYKKFFDGSREIQECISVLLKSQKLDEEQIKWIIENYKKSKYAINRLLRYPSNSKVLSNWAKDIYINELLKYKKEEESSSYRFSNNLSNNLLDRESEIIAILIDKDIPGFVDKHNIKTIMWAIYYARISDHTKQRLIKKYYNADGYEASVEVAKRLQYPSVLEFILEKI